ncbi:MAG: UvrD-helicase domain-containing protein [Elusimicrobia bacterium]|nr:UvrD-helicase domain-containing protein [Elusimicrobiota bacterium]
MPDAPDQADRDAARLRLDVNAVVEAGAGTGKTTLLTDRILFLVLGWDRPEPVSVERVVALTFTEKAAGEIKLRLSERLVELAARLSGATLEAAAAQRAERTLSELRDRFGKGEAELLTRARAAQADMDKASIGTIHSFCAQLLRLYPVEAGVDPGFRVDDGEAFEELFESEWARWLDAELGEAPPHRAEWLALLAAAELDDAEALARELCSEKPELEGLTEPDAEAARGLRALADAARAVPAGRPKPRGGILDALAASAARLEAAALSASAVEPAADVAEPSVPKDAKWPAAWEEDAAAQALYARARAVAARCSPRAEAATRRAARLLAPFAARFRREYARRGWVSFDGLLRRARDLARDHPRVRAQVQRRFATLLIDEFQDTDPLQGELLMFLAERPGSASKRWQDVVPEPGRLFVVGDPKQSIYRFRGADIAAYEGFVGRLRQTGALLCRLSANFRSTPEIVAPVNAAFSAAMRAEPGAQPEYTAILPARPSSGGGPAVRVVAVAGEGDADAARRAEAAWVAARIARDGRRPGEAAAGRRPLKDFAVLLRSSTALPAYLEAFKRAGLPYAVEFERFFYDSPEMADALNLLRALDDPHDRTALAGLLRSPLAALSDDGLADLARAGALTYRRDPPADALGADERRRATTLFASLRALRARAGREPLGDVVAAAFEATNLVELAARAYHGQQTASNLLKLRRMAAEASDARGATLKEFCARVREAARDSRREGESPLADERLEAVRVMSVHKSKGLEFPVVFAASLTGRPGGGTEKPALRLDPASGRAALRLGVHASGAMALADAREAELEKRESVRLLYVAMTRAREELWLLGREEPESHSLASHLLASGSWPQDGRDGRLPVERVRVDESVLSPSVTAAEPPRLDATAILARRRALAPAVAAAAAPRSVSATAYLAEAPKRPVTDAEEEGARSSAGAEVGQLCHLVLQEWDFSADGDLSSAVARARAALEFRAPGPQWTQAAREAEEILAAFFQSDAAREISRAEILGREVPFAYADGPTVVRGAVDLLYRLDGRLVVVDFKSGAVDARSAASARARYAEQGRVYVEAVRRAWGQTPDFRVLFLRRPDL